MAARAWLLAVLYLGWASPTRAASVLRFGDPLGLADVRLAGTSDSRRIPFNCEADWKARAGSELHLFVDHSPELDANRSFLSVSLNQGILRSFRLDASNRDGAEVVIPLPAAMLRRSNELLLSVEQFAAAGSERPWTTVRAASFLTLEYDRAPPPPAVKDLPRPLVDPLSYRPQTLFVLSPARPSGETIEATGRIVAQIAARLAPKPLRVVTVASPAEAGGAVLAVGTPSEQPAIASALAGRSLDPAAGAVLARRGPAPPPMVVVTAASPEAVRSSADGLLERAAGLEGAFATVPPAPPPLPAEPREWKDTVPPRSRFSLADLGYRPGQLALTRDAPVSIAVRTTPDARFIADAHRVFLELALLPELFRDPATRIEAAWNGASVGAFPVSGLEPPMLSAAVRIPAALLRPRNVLTLRVTGGDALSTRAPLAVVSPETAFYLPRAYSARLPDLSLLASSFYPFSIRADLSDVIVVVPDAPADAAFALVCELSGQLGRLVPSDRLAFRVRRASQLRAAERASAHLLLFETGERRSLVDAPALDWSRLPGGAALRAAPMLQELPSPWNRQRFVLRLRAASAAALLDALRRLAETPVLARLGGDTAFLGSSGPECYRVTRAEAFGETPYLTTVEAWLQTHWLALPVLAVAVSAGLFAAMRGALQQYAAAYLTSSKGASWRP
jgi:Bacterial cellulose synthase subunit